MASSLVDLVKINVSNTGSGAITLGSAVEGYRGRDVLTNGTVYSYSIQQGSAWEFGRGTYLAESAQIIRSVIDSSDGGTALNLKPNAQIAFTALSADLMPQVQLTADIQAKVDAATAAQTGAETARTGSETARDQSVAAKDTSVTKAGEASASATAADGFRARASNAVPFTTWTALAAATGMSAGDKAQVLAADSGTHTDPVVGGTVNNAGVYTYSASPAGWQRVADLDSKTAADLGAAQVALATTARVASESAANESQGYASTAGSASVSNLFSILSQVTSNPPSTASVIQSNGWRITNSAPADVSLGAVKVVRQGYSTGAVPVVWVDTLYRTKRVRQAYPNQASFTANEEALSDHVYSTDFVLGLINQSTEVSPKPTANWVMPHRLLAASTVHWEIVAFHRNASNKGSGGVGQQVACVRVRANNGTTATAWQTVSSTSISSYVEDANPVEVFQNDLDISSLADGGFWLEAEVYPWIGAAASVLKSEDNHSAGLGQREFTRRWFRKGATVNYVYVSSTGNDTTGVVSSTAATAAATPCLTIGGALQRARLALGTGTTGALDGLRIRIVDTITAGNPLSTFNPYRQDVAGVVIERAPGTARASAIVNIGAFLRPYFTDHTAPLTEGSLIFYDVTINYTGVVGFTGEAANNLLVQFWNCSINFGGFATNGRNNAHLSFFGVQTSNPHSTTFAISGGAGVNEIRTVRGVTADINGAGWEGWLHVGCNITRAGLVAFKDASRPWIVFNNKFLNPANGVNVLHWRGSVSGGTLGDAAIVQNLVERINTGNAANLRFAGDSDLGNIPSATIHHNTLVGIGDYGRVNIAYDEHPTVARTHKLISWKGNLVPQINVKGDDYAPLSNGARIGHFPVEHGVGFEGNFTRSVDAAGGLDAFRQAYPGLTSIIAGGDPLFTDYEGVTLSGSTPVAGLGGGIYTLQSGSPARNLLPYPVLKFDLAGNARGTGMQHAGAYQS